MELLSTFIVWLSPAVCSLDITMYLVLSAFTSSPISLVATTWASAFPFTVCMLPASIVTSSYYTRFVSFKLRPAVLLLLMWGQVARWVKAGMSTGQITRHSLARNRTLIPYLSLYKHNFSPRRCDMKYIQHKYPENLWKRQFGRPRSRSITLLWIKRT